jgi:glycosyltransferase involved in cell wall biosynthesis
VSIRVGVDATAWTNPRGFGRFTRNVTVELARRPGIVVELVTDGVTPDSAFPAGVVVNRISHVRRPVDAATAGSRRSLRDLRRAGTATRVAPYDVMLFPSPHTWFPVRGLPTVVGVHDVIARTAPELTFDSRSARLAWNLKERWAVRSATRLFSVSRAARAEVAAAFGLAEATIALVPEAADPVFHRPVDDPARELAVLGLAGQGYLLCAPGGISPHKSVETAVEAYARLRQRRDEVPPLVIVGSLDKDPYTSAASIVERAIIEHGLRESVVLTGFVSDDALAALYGGAIVVVNTSRAEGFGLPAVEAAACGAPVVLTDIPAHRESLGDAAAFFAPGDAEGLAELLGGLLREPAERKLVADRCRNAAAKLDWRASAAALEDILREAADDG